MGRLDRKVAIVTRAASRAEGVGNGAATAILFARDGARVVLVNRSADWAAGGGAIVNVSSLAGVVDLSGSPGAVAYTTTKAGLQGFTLSIAADYVAEGIRANSDVRRQCLWTR